MQQRDETYQLFASPLTTLLRYYIDSRTATNSYEKLCQLLVADRLKDALPSDALQYVLSLEGEEWFEPGKVASLADIFVNNCGDRGRVPVEVVKSIETQARQSNPNGETISRTSQVVRKCWTCGSDKHLSRSCDKNKKKVSNNNNVNNHAPHRFQTKACAVVNEPPVVEPVTDDPASKLVKPVDIPSVDCAFVSPTNSVVNRTLNEILPEPCLKISPLQYVNIVVNGKQLRALNDSGTQIPVISRSVLSDFVPVGQIQIQCVVGAPVATPLVALDVKLA